MTRAQEKARQNLVGIVGYFKMVAQEWDWHPWRKSEYEVVLATINLISTKDNYTKADFEAIASCVNAIVGQKHADGSGWHDFQLRVSYFYFTFGYKSDWDLATGKFIFWKESFLFWATLWDRITEW